MDTKKKDYTMGEKRSSYLQLASYIYSNGFLGSKE